MKELTEKKEDVESGFEVVTRGGKGKREGRDRVEDKPGRRELDDAEKSANERRLEIRFQPSCVWRDRSVSQKEQVGRAEDKYIQIIGGRAGGTLQARATDLGA